MSQCIYFTLNLGLSVCSSLLLGYKPIFYCVHGTSNVIWPHLALFIGNLGVTCTDSVGYDYRNFPRYNWHTLLTRSYYPQYVQIDWITKVSWVTSDAQHLSRWRLLGLLLRQQPIRVKRFCCHYCCCHSNHWLPWIMIYCSNYNISNI